MMRIKYVRDTTGQEWIETALRGKELLTNPFLNKGTAFTLEERKALGLLGKLPPVVESLNAQVQRAYKQYNHYQGLMQKHIYLNNLHDKNQTVFFKLLAEHLAEMLPIIYTPVVGAAVQQFSQEFRQPRGLYITPDNINDIDEILQNRTHKDARLFVITDGKGVLGLGDQGIGAMEIPIAKLIVYILLGGINPAYTLPIMLDVGTDNDILINDPFYLGLRRKRLTGEAFFEFVDIFVQGIRRNFPHAFLHWEDFGREEARVILDKYQQTDCTFNDDIQGTGAVVLAAIIATSKAFNMALAQHRIVVFGAGTAGVGVADQIYKGLLRAGINGEAARAQLWLIDKQGLLLQDTAGLLDFQKPYVRNKNEVSDWQLQDLNRTQLIDVVKAVKPTILIGCSAVRGAFNQEVITTMCSGTERALIFPLSNPDTHIEALPADILQWSQGKALVASGSPFPPVTVSGIQHHVAQCNNALIFPGIGLGVLAGYAKYFTDAMLFAAIDALAKHSPVLTNNTNPILPDFHASKAVALEIAQAVIEAGIYEGSIAKDIDAERVIKKYYWEANYRPIKPLAD